MLEKLKGINFNTILMIAIIILSLLYLKQCGKTSSLKDDIKIANMNNDALLDSVTSYTTKNGKLIFEKNSLIASKKELKDLNSELYKEIQYLKDNPKIVIKTETVVVHDTTYLDNIIIKYADGSNGLKWNHDTTFTSDGLNYQKLEGESKFYIDSINGKVIDRGTVLYTNEFGMSFTTGLTSGKDGYEIFVKSDYPGFKATNINGAVIDKKMIISNESQIVFGPSLGYGIVFTGGGNVNYGVIVGATATYNLNKPIKKLFRPNGL